MPSKMFEHLDDPPVEYSLAPFWFWNGDMDRVEVQRQVREMAEKNVRGAFIHGRFGLQIEYLSEEWFDRVAAALETAHETGSKMWLYDEHNWCSGYANGKVFARNPEFQEQHLSIEEHEVSGPGRHVEFAPHGHPVRAFLTSLDYEEVQDITEHWRDGQITLDLPDGARRIVYFLRRNSGLTHPITRPAHIDVLNPAATQAFIEITHEAYKKRFGHEFGKLIPGIFTDEPGFYHNLWEKNPNTVPWTKQFPEYFRKQNGYDICNRLLSLWHETGDWVKVRCDFYRTIADLFCEAYFKPIYDWCNANNLIFTGHLEWEEGLNNHIQFSGHLTKPFRYMHIPGVDKIDRNKRRLSEKQISSAAHLTGRKTVMSESYACSHWDLTLEEMKAVLDWQYVRGINMMCPHAFYYSIEDERKWECPPSEFKQNSFWPYFQPYSDYARRMSYLLSQGTHVANVAVYYPIHSAWALRHPSKYDAVNQLDKVFDEVGHFLLEHQVDYDIIDDEMIAEAKIEKGKLMLHGEAFKAIILPACHVLPEKTIRQIDLFAQNGGKVVIVGRKPERFLEDAGNAVGLNQDLFTFPGDGNPASRTHGQGAFFWIREGISPLIKLIEDLNLQDVRLNQPNPDIKVLHRRSDYWDLYFMVNEGDKEATVSGGIRCLDPPVIINVETGEEMMAAGFRDHCTGWTDFTLTFGPLESKLIGFYHHAGRMPEEIETAVPWECVLTLDNWRFTGGGMQIDTRPRSWTELGLPFYSGQCAYSTVFESTEGAGRVLLDLGRVQDIAEVRVNGKPCGFRAWRPYRFEITGQVAPGRNTLEVLVTNVQANEWQRMERPAGLLGPVKLYVAP